MNGHRLTEHLDTWALEHRIPMAQRGYTTAVTDNLFGGRLLPEVQEDFARGNGGELIGKDGKEPKMCALRSSSALAVNFFQHWLTVPQGITKLVAESPDADHYDRLRFESQPGKPDGVRGPSANLDLLIESSTGQALPIAIESKFTEHHARKLASMHAKPSTSEVYYKPDTWAHLPNCWAIVESIRANEQRAREKTFLDVPQLLKHILCLEHRYGRHQYKLVYLYYDAGGEEGAAHERELARFSQQLGQEALFSAMSYQTLFAKVRSAPVASQAPELLEYLGKRYFPAT